MAQKQTLDLDLDALRMVGTMLRLLRLIQRRFRDLAGLDLTLSDLSVLNQIKRGVDLPSAIADGLHLDRPRVSRISDRLVDHGYVDRTVDTADRRRSRLSLTPSGAELLERGQVAVSRAAEDVLAGVPEEVRASLMTSLEALRPYLDLKTPR